MAPAVFDQTVIEIDAGRVGLRATGQVVRFAGYLAIYAQAQDEGSPDDQTAGSLPDIHTRTKPCACSAASPSSTSPSRFR